MKKVYNSPELDLVKLKLSQVILSSTPEDEIDDEIVEG